jgi:hypothetical protein
MEMQCVDGMKQSVNGKMGFLESSPAEMDPKSPVSCLREQAEQQRRRTWEWKRWK